MDHACSQAGQPTCNVTRLGSDTDRTEWTTRHYISYLPDKLNHGVRDGLQNFLADGRKTFPDEVKSVLETVPDVLKTSRPSSKISLSSSSSLLTLAQTSDASTLPATCNASKMLALGLTIARVTCGRVTSYVHS